MSRRLKLYAGLAAALVACWSLFLYSPASKRITKLEIDIKTNEETIERLRVEVAELPSILTSQQILTDEEADRAQDLFTRSEILSLLTKIGRHCQEHRLKLTEVRPTVEELILMNQKHVDSPEPNFLNITLVLTGKYSSFGEFVIALERAPYFRGINYSRINAMDEGKKPAQYIVEFKTLLGRIAESEG